MDANLQVHQEGSHCHINISGELTIYGAAELKPVLLEHLAGASRLEINLAGVEEMDAAGFQLLYLLKREAKSGNKVVSLVAHSPAMLEVLALLNMEADFGDPLVLAS
ncbi:lipid asymmetry maintenance protein MlaB [Motiliproteus sp. SC1-56]|uniref:STAS domain-containing protein n=1 Tax=Motiliproteus sp. SC1-56 TaxID=2799565 RepID=UPI001A8CC7AB|nr:STAS domain-containing protein [Motiliproteus sp. SC1-56]